MKKVRLNERRRESSRNALKHGLAARLWTRDDGARVTVLTKILQEGRSKDDVEEAAKRAAAARSYLEQVIAARDKLLDAIHAGSQSAETEQATLEKSKNLKDCFTELSRLERYEIQATVRWERAVAELEAARLDRMTKAD